MSAVEACFTESALRAQQLGVWRAGEKTLRERQVLSDRSMVEAGRVHEAAVAALHRHFEAEASAMYKRVRLASTLKVVSYSSPPLTPWAGTAGSR